ncbi:MAG: glycoside hydrolase family 32 protein [Lachnospiraceae bacterium]|nr:glycoside hydrolase family 32 protein [Lachnospiraceae bacterium]
MKKRQRQLLQQADDFAEAYLEKIKQDPNRLQFHLMPPQGWLNDPNGLCYFQGKYHVFFQYSPADAEGGFKAWGHFVSEDLIHWEYVGIPLLPDQPFDWDGVYSGSACIRDDTMYLYCTGNVKIPGDHDYTYSGRESNTVLVTSTDGMHFSEKKCILTNADFPADYSCHVRDPKVWYEDGSYYMVQGGRKKGKEQDQGAVLLFTGNDPEHFIFTKEITTSQPFGYMWECPDYFKIEEKAFLSCSPQGLPHEDYRFQNVYQAGYFPINEDWKVKPEEFHEWDVGFDFYAPQTFLDPRGRRILIGWAGIPDAEYDNEPTVINGWQHALTVPRELTVSGDIILQQPVTELKALRTKEIRIPGASLCRLSGPVFDWKIQERGRGIRGRIEISCRQERVTLICEDKSISLQISEAAGRGRGIRRAKVSEIKDIRILSDTSLMEIYVNHGELVFTTRYYFETAERTVSITDNLDSTVWMLGK